MTALGVCQRGHELIQSEVLIPAWGPRWLSHVNEDEALSCHNREWLDGNLASLRAKGLHERLLDHFTLVLLDDDDDAVRRSLDASTAFLTFTDEQIASANAAIDR